MRFNMPNSTLFAHLYLLSVAFNETVSPLWHSSGDGEWVKLMAQTHSLSLHEAGFKGMLPAAGN